jgi:hypothetical protein
MQPETLTTDKSKLATESAAPILYDADAEQRMPFQTERRVGGEAKLFNVVHIFGPVIDEAVFQYERRRNQSLGEADQTEVAETGATAIESRRQTAAAIHYWDTSGARAEGYVGKVSDLDKAFAVNNMLFTLEFDELPLASAGELCPAEDDEASTYNARCIFDGKVVRVSATLRPATSAEIEEYQRLMSRTLLVRGQQFGKQDMVIPARSKRLAELFDSMKVSATGYSRRIPAHHRAAFAARHLRSEQKTITGN